MAWHLRRGFLCCAVPLGAYVAAFRASAPTLPETVATEGRGVAPLVLSLTHGWAEVSGAFRHHGRRFHQWFAVGLA